jgi:hypothetical protein
MELVGGQRACGIEEYHQKMTGSLFIPLWLRATQEAGLVSGRLQSHTPHQDEEVVSAAGK